MTLSWISLISFRQKMAGSLITVVSIACVTAVMLSVLALTEGMMKTMARTGLDTTLMVMRAGATSELESVIFPAEADLMANHEQIVRNQDGKPIVSSEMFVNAEYKQSPDVDGESLGLRGISADTYLFRPNFKLQSGALFKTGLRQIIIGRAVARRMPELTTGKKIALGDTDWEITGIFSDGNSVFESEIWADLGLIQNDYQRGNTIQSVRLALTPDTDVQMLAEEWDQDPRLNVRVILEKELFALQAQSLTRLIRWVGFPVAIIMAFGALVAALNTMYATISNRSEEIATHKAIGFRPSAIFASIICEATVLALVGGLLGVFPLYVLFDGWTASTQGASDLSQMMFNFDINLVLMSKAMLLSVLIGLMGGVLPAVKAIRLPVTDALRQI